MPQLREAERLLNEGEILASDAASYVDATQMDTALAELHRQQGQVRAMIVQVEAAKGRQGDMQVGRLVAIAVCMKQKAGGGRSWNLGGKRAMRRLR